MTPSRPRACCHERSQRPPHARFSGDAAPEASALLGVAIGLALLVVVNALVRQPSGEAAGGQFVGPASLPVVEMDKASAWRCPGPLPVGVGKQSSRVAIVNSGTSAVNLEVEVSRTGPPRGAASTGASISRARLEVDGDSQAVLPLTRRGPPGFAAVSVETDGGGIGVAESIVGGSSVGGPVLLSSPCSLAAAPQGYVPTGSTYGSSDVRLSLYDPDATPAVVDVSVSTGTTLTSPPAFQGWSSPLRALWFSIFAGGSFSEVPWRSLPPPSVEMSLSERSSRPPRRSQWLQDLWRGTGSVTCRVTGSSLLVGPDRGLRQWAFAAVQSRKGVASTFSVYDPGTRSVSVSVAPPGRAGIVAALTEDVPAGGIVDFATPVTAGSGLTAGSVVVSAQGGTPIVVGRLTTRYRTRVLEEVDATAGTAGPHDEWLLPGATVVPRIDDVVTLADPGTAGATVTLLELTHGATAPVRLEVVRVGAGSELEVDLGSVLRYAPIFALQVLATVPILVEQQLTPHHGLTTATGGFPSCAEPGLSLTPRSPGLFTSPPGPQRVRGAQTAVGGMPVEEIPGAAGAMAPRRGRGRTARWRASLHPRRLRAQACRRRCR